MSSEHSAKPHPHAPSRLLLIWMGSFLLVSAIASVIFFNVVREIVRTWNTTQLTAPVTSSMTVTDPKTGQPVVEIQDWTGVERVTLLLLGIDEREQETGPWRTDTMMVLTIDPASKTAGMLSIPRDLWVPISGMDTEGKINTAHFLGDAYNYPGGGPALAVETVRENLGLPIDYYVRLNFGGFEKLIDAIDGVEICVPEAIDDPLYPDSGFGYEPLHIGAGCQVMNGRLALKYARTRHEGNGDFDRARRQQQVILAVRDKIVNQNMLPQLVAQAPALLDTLKESAQTDLTLDQIVRLGKLATQIDPKNIKQALIDESMVARYMAPTNPPQDVLVPIRDQIRELRARFLSLTPANTVAQGGPSAPSFGSVRIRVENATFTDGLAARTRDRLNALGFNVVEIGSPDRFDYAHSQIIDYANQAQTATELAKALGLPATSIVTSTANSNVDIKVILGQDYQPPANVSQTR